MKKDQSALLFVAGSGMVLSWRYAWATFLMTAIVQRPFPLPEAIGTFFLAVALSRVVRGLNLRMISVLGLHIIGFLVAISRIVFTLNYRTYSYFGKGWWVAFFGRTRDPIEWFTLVIIFILTMLFWVAGVKMTRKPTAYLTTGIRFDYGVSAFFCLFLAKSLLLIKGGIDVKDPAPEFLLFPFFIFSLLAIGLARNRSGEHRDFLVGYRGVGVMVGFTVAVLTFGAGLVLLFMSYLRTVAEAGYEVLKSGVGPLGPLLVRMLLFIFGRQSQQEPPSSLLGKNETALIASGEGSWWTELVQKILGGGLLGLLLLMGLFLCAFGTWYLLRWLFARKSKEQKNTIHWQLALLWVQRLLTAFAMCLKGALQRLKGYRDAAQLYRAFLKWGLRSGIPHLLNETPAEYGSRLRKRFPPLAGEIGWIVDTFNLMVYGKVAIDDEQMNQAQLSLRKLRSLRYWPTRLKSWFFQEMG